MVEQSKGKDTKDLSLVPLAKVFKKWACSKCYANFDQKKDFKKHYGQCKEKRDMFSLIKLVKSMEDGDQSAVKDLRDIVSVILLRDIWVYTIDLTGFVL